MAGEQNWTKFQIDTGVPIPTRRKSSYPPEIMAVGDSIFVPHGLPSDGHRITAAIGFHRKRGRRFATRAVTENGVVGSRVWRVA